MSFFHCYEIPLSCLESSSRTARGYPGCQRLFLRDYLVDVCYCRPARKAYLALCLSCDSSTPRGRTKSSGTQGGSLMRLSHVQRWKALLYRCVHCIPCGDVWTWCLITRSTGVHIGRNDALFLAEFYPKDIHLSQDEWKWPFFVLLSLRGRRRRGEGRRNLPSPSPFGTGRVG